LHQFLIPNRCAIQTGVGMFQGSVGLMAYFFAAAIICGNDAR